ncbi:MAG TPA: ATP synthase F1 subunit delta [Terriglobales bacterium]|nr:ATP synthase F1 subunit delta [Terriglobales bacterium]
MAVVTSRYARAFADVIVSQRLDINHTIQQVRSVVELVKSSVELRRVWENPSILPEQKRKLLDAIAVRMELAKPVRNFMAVLIDHHRIHQLEEIVRAFELEMHERMGLTEADVISARELSEVERRDIESKIASMTGKRVLANYQTDSSLIGGALVKLGSTIYDGSVRGQLMKMKETLSS